MFFHCNICWFFVPPFLYPSSTLWHVEVRLTSTREPFSNRSRENGKKTQCATTERNAAGQRASTPGQRGLVRNLQRGRNKTSTDQAIGGKTDTVFPHHPPSGSYLELVLVRVSYQFCVVWGVAVSQVHQSLVLGAAKEQRPARNAGGPFEGVCPSFVGLLVDL